MSTRLQDVASTLVGMSPIEDAPRPRAARAEAFTPAPPMSVEATGLSRASLESLCLKHLFQAGELRGAELSRRVCLPSAVVDEVLEHLRVEQLVDIAGSSGTGLGRSTMIFRMTEAGQKVCAVAMERDRYVGPAPVPFPLWTRAVAAQTIRGGALTRAELEPHFRELVLGPDVFDTLGPAMNSGKALFFHGPPGNGKTEICRRMTRCFGGDVFVPYAVQVDDFVVQLFDEAVHQRAAIAKGEPLDERWVRCRRPMVFVGGELMLEELDLAYSPEVRFYEAPLQMKASCGVLLVDDFGRQRVSPRDLLNRWIVPLESELDFLTLHTGRKIQIPFDVFVVFSTNLEPSQLVDQAFLRRVRYKLEVKRPDRRQFDDILIKECDARGIAYDAAAVGHLVQAHYDSAKRPFNACEPRDLLAQVEDLCAYRGEPAHLSKEILDRVATNYFVSLE